MNPEKRKTKSAKELVFRSEYRPRRERSKKTDYSRKGKNKFDPVREY